MSRPQLLLLCLSALFLTACGAAPPSRVGIGPFPQLETDARWDQTLEALSDLGYPPNQTDRQRGQVLVNVRADQAFLINLQLTTNGWIRMAITDRGGRELGKPGMPAGVGAELVELSMGLRERLREAGATEAAADDADDDADEPPSELNDAPQPPSAEEAEAGS